MRTFLFGLLIFFSHVPNALAYGAIASGDNGRSLNFTAAYNEGTAEDAGALSLQRCQDQGLTNCAIRWNFQNICASVGLTGDYTYRAGQGDSPFQARQNMFVNCVNARSGMCIEVVTVCDQTTSTPSTEEAAATGSSDTMVAAPASIIDQVFGYLDLAANPAAFAKAITLALLVWLFVSVCSTIPVSVLKQRVLISVWVSGPAILQFALEATAQSFGPFGVAISSLSLWTTVFAALILGGRLRQRLSPKCKTPNPLSLPLAVVLYTIISATLLGLYIHYIAIGYIMGCAFGGDCHRLVRDQVYTCVIMMVSLIICGAVLSPDSNVVLANDGIGRFIRTSLATFREKRRERREQAKQALVKSEDAGSYPVPALYTPAASDVMRLKLKRSQRSSVFGKVIFVLDARMEVTQEELNLVRKYRLGGDLIYESGDRQRRRETTLAHLEKTKEGPGLRDSPSSQLWGVAKSFFWFGRAGLSAAAAALSLRITTDSLLSAVHVECKSMGELLEAERAIREAAENLRAYLDVARTFDGREEIVEL
jgi:hypothetical protein